MSPQFTHGYALLIGVGQSQYAPWSLPVTVQDAQALQTALTDPNLCAYPPDHIRLLHDETATRQGILDGLDWLGDCCMDDPDATALVYFSGHGWREKGTGRYFLIPHDVAPFQVTDTALAAADFTQKLRIVLAARLLVIIDSCHAAGMATAKAGESQVQLPPNFSKSAAPEPLVAQLKQGEGRAVFTSSRGTQRSWVRQDRQLSIYTHHLLEALDGAGSAAGDTLVHVSHLMKHLAQQVPLSAQQQAQAEQTPFFDMATEDFPVALLRGGKGLSPGGWQKASAAAQQAGVSYQATVSDKGTSIQGKKNVTATGGSIAIGGVTLGSQPEQTDV